MHTRLRALGSTAIEAHDDGLARGSCDERFAAVREAVRENVACRGELGAAVAVTVEGRRVVDLWCGWADAERRRRWSRETLVNVFSVGKALVAVCALMLVSRGELALEEPVAERWPQFAAAGKERITLRDLLGHRAGLPAIARRLPDGALYDWSQMTDALAAQQPWWEPGTAHGYHVHTFGFLVGELVRRASGRTIGELLRSEIAEPLRADLSFGLARGQRGRRAEYVFDAELGSRLRRGGREPDLRLRERAYMNPPGATGIGTVNTAAWQDAELPSANLHADARAIAWVYDALLDRGDGPALLDADVLALASAEVSAGEDLVLGRPSRFGLGFQLTQRERPLGPNEGSFGHFGAGGSLGFADPVGGVA
ncbi:MAG TPA: serine hydrolase domain-containing protein, partial [Solirubrobacteraceae bacterium]|nr:serine hydrolase domain-containing protein [Solirubrobacteraceae bacterium]